MPRLTDERGQSTLEYVAVVALLAVLVTAVGAAAMAPTYVNAAVGGFQRRCASSPAASAGRLTSRPAWCGRTPSATR